MARSDPRMPLPLAPPSGGIPEAPRAARRPVRLEAHGDVRIDDWFWLRDRNDPEVIAYLEAENRYTEAMTAGTAALREALYREIVGHVRESDVSVPCPENGFLYYSRTETAKQYPIHCRRRGSLESPEEVILDLNALAGDGGFLTLGDRTVSDDGRLLAYTIDRTGDRDYTLRFRDLETGETLPDRIERVAAESVAWAADGRTVLYAVQDDARRPYRVHLHRLGESRDPLLYEEGDERFDAGVGRSRSGRFLFVASASHTTTEVRFIEAADPGGALRLVAAREAEHEYDVDHQGDVFWIRTNGPGADGRTARNFRVVTAPVADPEPARWREVVPERADAMIEGIDCFARHVVRWERAGGLPRVVVTESATGASHAIAFDEPVFAVRPTGNREYETSTLRYAYESLVTPPSVYDYAMDRRAATLLKRTEVPGYDPALFVQERIEAPAPDGARIPISLVRRRSTPRDGTAPMDLWGYGSYGMNFPIRFDAARLPLLDRGVVYGVAHVRGGAELGKAWHDAGRMACKATTFSDFVAAAERLIALRYTASDRLVIEGRSAGGLLMGAVLNLRPDLFRAVVTAVPFVDVLSTMLDASLPLTVTEYEEWGNPNVAAEYAVMRAYSPYDNLVRRSYPAILVRTALNDSQVPYWEPAKLVAKLRTLQESDRPILLKTDLSAGHGGASGRYDAYRERAFDLAFLLTEVGIDR